MHHTALSGRRPAERPTLAVNRTEIWWSPHTCSSSTSDPPEGHPSMLRYLKPPDRGLGTNLTEDTILSNQALTEDLHQSRAGPWQSNPRALFSPLGRFLQGCLPHRPDTDTLDCRVVANNQHHLFYCQPPEVPPSILQSSATSGFPKRRARVGWPPSAESSTTTD